MIQTGNKRIEAHVTGEKGPSNGEKLSIGQDQNAKRER